MIFIILTLGIEKGIVIIMNTKKYRRVIINIIISFLFVIGLRYMSNTINNFNVVDSVLLVILFYILEKKKIMPIKLDIIYSIICTIIFVIGKEIYLLHNINNIFDYPLSYICKILGVFIIFTVFFIIFRTMIQSTKLKYDDTWTISKKTLILMIVSFIIMYSICYISYFPGLWSYDISVQHKMAIGEFYLANNNPVIHTMLWKFFVILGQKLGNDNFSVIFYTIFQIIVVITTYVYFIIWTNKHKWNKKYIMLIYLYLLLNPLFQLFSIEITKDVIFSCCLLFLSMGLSDLYNSHKKIDMFLVIIFGTLACLLRNNMIYVIIVCNIFFIFITKDKKILLSLTIIILVDLTTTNIIYDKLGIYPVSKGEMLSVPLIQMSKVLNEDNIYTKYEINKLKTFSKDIYKFNPRFADYVKLYFDTDYYSSNKKEFWKLYLKGFKHNPYSYLCSFLDLNIPYWYANSIPIDDYSQRAYIEEGLYNKKLNNNIPNIFKFTKKIYHSFASTNSKFMNLPIISFYFSLSFPFYMLILSSYCFFLRKQNRINLCIVIVYFLLFCTYLLGPVSNFRYIYPFYVAIPMYFGINIMESNNNKENDENK